MNTGHDGSLGTIHANRPREALTRLENMVAMAGFQLPLLAVRTQIAAAVQLIVQVARMRDGKRRITSITEVTGIEGDVITLQELFHFEVAAGSPEGTITGEFLSAGVQPKVAERVRAYGLGDLLKECMAR
jgi:pilus assembly protein CpaF